MVGNTQGPVYLDDLAHFLGRVAPWSGAGEPTSYINLHFFTPAGSPQTTTKWNGGGRAYASQNEFGDIQQMISNANQNGVAVFMCMSSRDAYEPKVTARGRAYRRALRRAPKSNPVALRALWLDLDVKPGGYSNQRAALAAVLPFLDKLGLPPSMIVSSGTGVHVYILFDQLISPQVWQPLANALIAAALKAGIKFDVGVSRDDDRIMRVPTSFNRKDWNNPLPVRILGAGRDFTLAEVTAALKPWIGLTSGVGTGQPRSGLPKFDPAVLPPRRPITSGPLFDRVSADLAKNRIVTSFDLLRGACPVVADSEGRGGDGDPEPLWFELAKLCHYIEGGRDHFHRLSDRDDRYERNATDLKFDQVQKDGWPSCAAIEQSCGAAAAICQRCVNRGVPVAGNPKPSPIHFAQRALPGTVAAALPMHSTTQPLNIGVNGVNGHAHVQAFTAVAPVPQAIILPPSWMINPSNGLLHHLDHLTGQMDPKPVFDVPVTDVRMVEHETIEHLQITGGSKNRMHRFPIGQLCSSQRDATSHLFSAGLHFQDYGAVRVFLMDLQTFIRTNRQVYEEIAAGWQRDTNRAITAFSYGGRSYSPAGVVQNVITDDEDMRPMGSLAVWRQAANFFLGRDCLEMEALMSTAYGAPLMPFTGVDGVIVYGHSGGTGYGKSASVETAQSVWGPREAVMKDATSNSTIKRLTKLVNLPAVFDEFIKKKDYKSARQLTELVYNVSSGQDKGRLTRSGKQQERKQSQTIMLTAGNSSLVELASTNNSNAIAARILEIRMSDAVRKMRNQQADMVGLMDITKSNYGTAGAIYSEFLGRHHTVLQSMVLDTMREFQRRSGVDEEGRFWLAAAAAMFVGASISHKLDLQKFDITKLQNFLIEQVRLQKTSMFDAQVDSDDPDVAIGRVGEFINEQRQSTIICQHMPKRGGGQAKGIITNIEEVRRARSLAVRHATTDKVIEVSEDKLKAWCQQKEISYVGLRRVLDKGGYISLRNHKRPVSLTRGLVIENDALPERVLHFDLTLPINASLVVGVDDV